MLPDTTERSATGKSQWVSADRGPAAAPFSIRSPWLGSIWQYADHVGGRMPLPRGYVAPAPVYWGGSLICQ